MVAINDEESYKLFLMLRKVSRNDKCLSESSIFIFLSEVNYGVNE